MQRRLIVNADDFGESSAVNAAVAEAHDRGVLTCASLLVTGDGFDEAVGMARERPGLGVGLHLALSGVRSALPAGEWGSLAGRDGQLRRSAVRAGLAYYFRRGLRDALEREIAAQVAAFRSTGLELDHVSGHLQMHEHPVVFALLLRRRDAWSEAGYRLVRDPLPVSLQLGGGRWMYRLSHALIFCVLARVLEPQLAGAGVCFPRSVFGLLENGCVTEDYLLALLDRLPPGDSEVYAHPCRGRAEHELEALTSPRVRRRCDELRIQRIRYRELGKG